ncbi:MAG: hypothetical protein LUH10_11705 [Tannerellaceae bacterium]|nr:hypothetical protein [Tannerellaceae bacterium]
MKKSLLFLILLLSCSFVYGQKKIPPKDEMVSFLIEHSYFRDPNFTHQEAADRVYNLFKSILLEDKKEKSFSRFKGEALDLYYENSVSLFEDSPDVWRHVIRKTFSLLSLALIADEFRYESFLTDALYCLSNMGEGNYKKEEAIVKVTHLLIAIELEDPEYLIQNLLTELQDDIPFLKEKGWDKKFITDYIRMFQQKQ